MKQDVQHCETVFLGWDSPLLPGVAKELRTRFASGGRFDLSGFVCVLPSGRGTDRLRRLIEWESEEYDLQLSLPDVITVGQLASRLHEPSSPVALDFEQTLAWAHVLMAKHPDDLQPLVTSLPSSDSVTPWLELAGTIRRLHTELASNGLTFDEVAAATESENERNRWTLLSDLFAGYLDALQDAGLVDPYWSRREAVQSRQCKSPQRIILVGTTDLNEALIAMLRGLNEGQRANEQAPTIAFIAAPPSEAFRFDEFGNVQTQTWLDYELSIDDRQLIPAADVTDQAEAVAETIADYANRFSADQVTIGVTDESLVSPIELQMRGCGVATYRHLGWTVAETAVGRLFQLSANYLQRRSWQSLAALVRHADVHAFITRQLAPSVAKLQQASGKSAKGPREADWLVQLDQMLSSHFPLRVTDKLPPIAQQHYPLAVEVATVVEGWLAPLMGSAKTGKQAIQPVAKWSVAIDQWLVGLYGADENVADSADGQGSRTSLAVEAARRMIDRFTTLNQKLDVPVSGPGALEMIAGRLAELRVTETAQPDDVEILGWLDLALDDAPALAIVGMNHPFVPAAVTSDPFLPGSLRTRLRMADNERRYARDVYALHLMLSSRPAVRLIVGRTGADGSPTPPSRLLAAASLEDSARRIRNLFEVRREAVSVKHRWDDGPAATRLPIPTLPIDEHEVTTMSVTAFRDYLACPYRFYLRHVLKMRPLDDSTSELAANQFGDLVHGALENFGDSPDKDETEPSKIEAAMIEHLHAYAKENYGDATAMAVKLQVKQAELRLKVVAQRQADRIAEGWEIRMTEASVSEKATHQSDAAIVHVDGKPMGLRGRFDRIDYHRQTGRWAILDYKTHGHKPEKKHLKGKGTDAKWIDLQLPLYRMMIPFLRIDASPTDVQLGYFNISEKDAETKINIADFDESLMKQAERLIHDCIRGIWNAQFEPTEDRVPFDDYEMILQTGVTQSLLDIAARETETEAAQ